MDLFFECKLQMIFYEFYINIIVLLCLWWYDDCKNDIIFYIVYDGI